MTELPFDPQCPPETPPPEVRKPLMWRMGHRLVADHQRSAPAGSGSRDPVCRCCRARWPCQPQLLGRRGLVASLDRPSWPGGRSELADGRLVLAPPPSRGHERVVANLIGRLRLLVPDGTAVRTGQTLHLPDGDAPVPDVVVACERRALAPSSVHTVVEVIGADGGFFDRVWKRARYEAAGIPCFWRVELAPWPGYRGPLPVVVARVREPAGWREVVAAAGQVQPFPVAHGRARGGVAVATSVLFDPGALTAAGADGG